MNDNTRKFTIHLCDECPWYQGTRQRCKHPGNKDTYTEAGIGPPPGCPLRGRPHLLHIGGGS